MREILNPSKSAEELERETQEGHKVYVHSHNAYFVGKPTSNLPLPHCGWNLLYHRICNVKAKQITSNYITEILAFSIFQVSELIGSTTGVTTVETVVLGSPHLISKTAAMLANPSNGWERQQSKH